MSDFDDFDDRPRRRRRSSNEHSPFSWGCGLTLGITAASLFLIGLPILMLFLFCGGLAALGIGGSALAPPDKSIVQPIKQGDKIDIQQKGKPPVDLSKGIRHGEIAVLLQSAKVQLTSLRDLDRPAQSANPNLSITLKIENKHATKRLEYNGWSSDNPFVASSNARLVDEHGNVYKQVTFGFATKIEGQIHQATIDPGQSITDTLVFEKPIPAASTLTLTLPMNALGQPGEIVAAIPKSFVK